MTELQVCMEFMERVSNKTPNYLKGTRAKRELLRLAIRGSQESSRGELTSSVFTPQTNCFSSNSHYYHVTKHNSHSCLRGFSVSGHRKLPI